MVCVNRGCLGNYDFDKISFYAHKRFAEGYRTVVLLQQAKSQHEKEEITLVAKLDIEGEKIRDLQLVCPHTDECKVTFCKDKIKMMLEETGVENWGQPSDIDR